MQAQAGMEEERWTEQGRWEGRIQAEEPFSVFCLFGSTSSCISHREEKGVTISHHPKVHNFSTELLTAALSSIWKSLLGPPQMHSPVKHPGVPDTAVLLVVVKMWTVPSRRTPCPCCYFQEV